MVQEKPVGASVLDEYRKRAADRMGRRSINVLPANALATPAAERDSTDPSRKSKKRTRDGGNIATTTRSPGSIPTLPPCREMVEAGSLSPRQHGANIRCSSWWTSAIDLGPRSSRGESQIHAQSSRGYFEETRESIRSINPLDLLKSGLELMCRSIVLVEHEIEGRDRHAKVISRLEKELIEARENLKRSLAAVGGLSTSAAREVAKREIAEKSAAEARRILALAKEEALRAAAEAVEVKKTAEEKLSSRSLSWSPSKLPRSRSRLSSTKTMKSRRSCLSSASTEQCAKPMFSMGGCRALVNSTWIMRFTRIGWFRVPRWGLWRHRRLRRPGPMRGRSRPRRESTWRSKTGFRPWPGCGLVFLFCFLRGRGVASFFCKFNISRCFFLFMNSHKSIVSVVCLDCPIGRL